MIKFVLDNKKAETIIKNTPYMVKTMCQESPSERPAIYADLGEDTYIKVFENATKEDSFILYGWGPELDHTDKGDDMVYRFHSLKIGDVKELEKFVKSSSPKEAFSKLVASVKSRK